MQRHNLAVRIQHWLVVLSTFTLIFTGIGQMPVYKRYMVDQLPGLAWSSDYGITVMLHYIAGIVLVFAAVLHLCYLFFTKNYDIIPRKGDVKESFLIIKAMFGLGEEPPQGKYLAEQRLAYAYMVFWFAVIIITGIVKMIKNFPGVYLPAGFISLNTHLHNLSMIFLLLGIIAHLAAFLLKPNWPLVPSMFTGRVNPEYAKKRHPLWYYAKLHRTDKPSA
ncbi:MAG TPA: cytochrome b/b6 domain-containing protein [Clostridia bacterium]|nr:cytochrome b/b6 domain-containing protein [Clostridia bacterium]